VVVTSTATTQSSSAKNTISKIYLNSAGGTSGVTRHSSQNLEVKNMARSGARASTGTTRVDIIRTALNTIAQRNGGRVTREAVVAAARNPKHALHPEFDWNDKTAAETQRLAHAQVLIVRYLTVVTVHRSQRIVTPFYVRDPKCKPREQGHIAITSDEINREMAETICANELARCESGIERGRSVVGFLDVKFPGIADEFEELLSRIVGIRRRLAEAA
jgi:hypothetical protein